MRNLVFVAAGTQSLHKEWTHKVRDFDVMIAYYDKSEPSIKGIRQCSYKGTKFEILYQAYQDNPDFNDYDAILVLDDDLFVSVEDLNEFFNIFHQYDL